MWWRWMCRWSSAWAIYWFGACTASLVDAGGWLMRPLCNWIVHTNATMIDFHTRTWFLCIFGITYMFKVYETKTTRSTGLWIKWAIKFVVKCSPWDTIDWILPYLCIKNYINSLDFAIFWENFINFVFSCASTEPKYTEAFGFWWWL